MPQARHTPTPPNETQAQTPPDTQRHQTMLKTRRVAGRSAPGVSRASTETDTRTRQKKYYYETKQHKATTMQNKSGGCPRPHARCLSKLDRDASAICQMDTWQLGKSQGHSITIIRHFRIPVSPGSAWTDTIGGRSELCLSSSAGACNPEASGSMFVKEFLRAAIVAAKVAILPMTRRPNALCAPDD